MNAKTFARIALFCAAGLAAITGAEAKGSLGIGLTIVSSCSASSAQAYRAAAAVGASSTAVVAGCTGDTNYTVSLSQVAAADAQQPARPAESRLVRAGANDVVVTLTY